MPAVEQDPLLIGGSNPRQYDFPPGCHMLQDLIEFRDMNFAVGNIFKACFRLGHCDHSDTLRDLNKILWFAERERDRILKTRAEQGAVSVPLKINSLNAGWE